MTPALADERRRYRLALGAMVRSLRLGQGEEPGEQMSQTTLAERVGVSRWTISQMELGNSAISSDVLFTIFRVLGGLPSITREIFEVRFDDDWRPTIFPTDPFELRKLSRKLHAKGRVKGKPNTRK